MRPTSRRAQTPSRLISPESALAAEDNELNMEIIAYVLDDMGFTVG